MVISYVNKCNEYFRITQYFLILFLGNREQGTGNREQGADINFPIPDSRFPIPS
ncbi:MAG: hypothetical protein F6K55_35730 [Moorea sp. SIO4A3]|nr:hypothetical protein [Moorena sp. SIO4A3]